MQSPIEQKDNETPQSGLMERFQKSWFPPAAVAGAFIAFVAAALRVRPTPKTNLSGGPKPAPPGDPETAEAAAPPAYNLERKYSESQVVDGGAVHAFRSSLFGIAVDSADEIYALGDKEVRVFQPGGEFVRSWKVPETSACLTVDAEGRVFVGALGRVEIYSPSGDKLGGFAAGEQGRPAEITAIKVFRDNVLVADAAARYIRRYDTGGKELGEIGTQNKTGCFMLPNRSLGFDVDAEGIVRAGDPGRHRVTSWKLDGSPLGFFGRFGQQKPEDFVGCCNPVNIAVTPDGKIVTAEKAKARVKVYEPGGKLIALIGPEHFDPACTTLHLAVDSKERILAGDPVRREVKIFSLVTETGDYLLPVDLPPQEYERV